MTIDRHLLGDVGLAVLLVLPTAMLTRPQVSDQRSAIAAPPIHQLGVAERSPLEQRFSLPG